MRIAVVLGSPKGADSLTLIACKYIAINNPDIQFSYHYAATKISNLEKDEQFFNEFISEIAAADGLIWAFPVYTLLVPAQLQRFIELIYSRNPGIFSGKHTTTLSTSVIFYDHTAHNYMYEVFTDFKMNYIKGISLASDDLQKPEIQNKILSFSSFFFEQIRSKHSIQPLNRIRNNHSSWTYTPSKRKESMKEKPEKDRSKRVIIVTDYESEESNLKKMIDVFQSRFFYESTVYNIRDLRLEGGCLGCMDCFITEQCIHKDRFSDFHQQHLYSYDAIVYALTLKNHTFSTVYKTYQDRLFYNGHQEYHESSPSVFLISGNLKDEPNIQQVIEAMTEVGHQFCAGIVTDEQQDSSELDRCITAAAENLDFAMKEQVNRPQNFLGLAGIKVLRDEVYKLKHFNRKDHRFYQQHHFYNYPHKDIIKRMKGAIMGSLIKLSRLDKKNKLSIKIVLRKLNEKMLKL